MSKASERRIILGVDDSPSGRAALQWAVSQARIREAQLVAVRSWALGLPRHGGRHHRHIVHPSVSRYCRSHAGCPVVVVPTDQESL
jgi:nucleotide-binding universal stress UspA family protein